MSSMEEGKDGEPPPSYFGDYPHGASWSAVRREDVEENAEDHSVTGPDLTVMWDEGAGPLWTTNEGLLPDDPEWMKRALGLSDSLVADLLIWLHDMDHEAQHHPPTTSLAGAGEQLAVRLQREVGSRFEVHFYR
jgi:hypothetical protein